MIAKRLHLTQESYMQDWVNIQQKLLKQGFEWAAKLEEDEWHQYLSLDAVAFSKKEVERIRQLTIEFRNIIHKTYEAVMRDGSLFRKLVLPYETYDIASMYNPYVFSYFCRFDIIQDAKGEYRFIEINSDTPAGYLEASAVNAELCLRHELDNPNRMENAIKNAWNGIALDYGITDDQTIYFTAFSGIEEDKQTALCNMKHCPFPKKEFIPVEKIMVDEEGCYAPDGRVIKYLYRFYPIECFPQDKDEDGRPIGNMLMQHVVDRKIHLINPPSAFVTQSKALLAIMHEEIKNIFNPEEREWVLRHVPKTAFSPEPFEGTYVAKPMFGREGGGVTIVEKGKVVDEERTPEYFNQFKIYQEYIEMPDLTLDTWDGEYTGKMLIGSHLIDGEPEGLIIRVGDKITGPASMCVGVGIEKG